VWIQYDVENLDQLTEPGPLPEIAPHGGLLVV